MAYQKILGIGTRALQVIPSDLCEIPYPGNHIVTSANTAAGIPAGGVTALTDNTVDFLELGVEVGDIVYNTGGTSTTTGGGLVLTVIDETRLLVSCGTGLAYDGPNFSIAVPYTIYKKGDYPCMLYFGALNKFLEVSAISAGGDIISNSYLIPGQTTVTISQPIPVQVRKLNYTGTGPSGAPPWLNCLAVW